MADGTFPIRPRLLTLTEAKAYLGGLHPSTLGCSRIGLKWDRVEIDHKLDLRAGIESPSRERKGQTPANDSDAATESEFSALERRIAAASGRL